MKNLSVSLLFMAKFVIFCRLVRPRPMQGKDGRACVFRDASWIFMTFRRFLPFDFGSIQNLRGLSAHWISFHAKETMSLVLALQFQNRQPGGQGRAALELIFRVSGWFQGDDIAEFMPSAQIQGEIGFPEIVHDPAADFSAVERYALAVAQFDRRFLLFPERNQRGIGTGYKQIKGTAPAQDPALQAPKLLACARQLIQTRAHHTAGLIDPGFIVPVCLERKNDLDFFRVRTAFLFQSDPCVHPR